MVDILLSTYNGSKYLKEQLDSIFVQTYKEWHLIIRDDGSNDDTLKILYHYKKKYPSKISIMEDKQRIGPALSYFKLLEISNADYIMFCDQDDVWYVNKIEECINRMIEIEKKYKLKPILIHSDLEVVDESLNLIHKSLFQYQNLCKKIISFKQFFFANNVTGCTVMINKFVKNICLPVPNGVFMHDMWIAVNCKRNDGILFFIDKPLVKYRQHGKNNLGAKKINKFNFLKSFFLHPIEFLERLFKEYKFYISQLSLMGEGSNFMEYIFLKIKLKLNNIICS